jgi:hypothetical protein
VRIWALIASLWAQLHISRASFSLHFFTMSSGASTTTTRNAYGLNIRNMTFFSKPEIDISLARSDDSQDSYVTSYSTLDKIEGVATISAKKDTRFDELQISFVGKFFRIIRLRTRESNWSRAPSCSQ